VDSKTVAGTGAGNGLAWRCQVSESERKFYPLWCKYARREAREAIRWRRFPYAN